MKAPTAPDVPVPGAVAVSLSAKPASGRRSYAEARQSPCLSCSTSPCCTHLPLHTFQVRTLLELDHALYLLNFDNIVVGISSSGDWSVYYRQACGFLDAEFGCTLHDTDEQPRICVHYNPYSCWYRKVLTVDTHDDFVRLDPGRVRWLLDQVVFDDDNTIVEVPAWEAMVSAFEAMPLQVVDPVPPVADPVADAWRTVVLGRTDEASAGPLPAAPAGADPCTGCDASCCSTLVFPAATPLTASGLDYLRFCVGFPGVELGIRDGGWSLVIKTRCRHLEGTRCGVYGTEERPLLCRYYDAAKCSYRAEFSTPTPEGFLRVGLAEFASLSGGLRYDGDGSLVEMPALDDLRRLVEDGIRSTAAATR